MHSKLSILDDILRSPLPKDGVLHVADENSAIQNIRKGLRLLGYNVTFGSRHDREFRMCVLNFQQDHNHDNQDGHFGPGTSRLLARLLIEKFGDEIFSMISPNTMEWDVFLSHASEDKGIAKPLVELLREKGLLVWYDEDVLVVGDSLRRSIDKGLLRSRYGVVFISPAFLEKQWPQRELDGLVTKEIDGKKVILPVWHNIDAAIVQRYSLILADRVATSTSKGLELVVSDLLKAMEIP